MAEINASSSEQEITKNAKFRIIKNLVLISLSFFLLFTAYDGLSMLQSTMNKKSGIGVISQAVGYVSFCMSAFLLPKYVIKKLGCKSSLIMSLGFYVPCIAANFYPKWYIMIPTGVLGGIGASILWGSQCTYFNESAVRYAKLITGERKLRSQTQIIPSNCTSVEILSDRISNCEVTEENTSKDFPSIKDELKPTTSEDTVVRYKCQNPSCEHVDEFVVSEIEKNSVKFVKNTADSTSTSHTGKEKESGYSEHFQPINISPSTAQTHEIEGRNLKEELQEVTKISKAEEIVKGEGRIMKEDLQDWTVISKVEDIVKSEVLNSSESISPKRNTDHQPIFQRASTLEFVTGLFFGCHGIAYYSAQICSNVISYFVLKGDDVAPLSNFGGCSCGANFCNDNPWCISEDTEYVSKNIRFLLTGICVAIASISVLLVFFFVDPLKKAKSEDEPEKISLRLVSATFNHNKKKEQLCLIPLSFFEGMQQGFYTADFTKSYVVCAWGASNVGLVSVFYGSACVISSSTSGFLVKYVGRMPLFLIGQVISISMMVFLMLWKPDSDTPYKFYIASSFFGVLTGIYWSQLLAFYGLLFKKDEEAAFASYYLWSSLGWTTSFLYSDHLCTYIKIYLLLTVSIIGTSGYLFAERSYGLRKQLGTLASS